MAQPIELHYWPTPNGHKITIALEEMGLAYEIKPVNIGKGDQFKPEFLAISPNNRMPAIVDPEGPDGKPISVFESGAILQYLGRKTGQLYGANERNRVEVEEWLMWQMGGLGPMLGQSNHFRNYARAMVADQRQIAYGAIRYTNEAHRLAGVLNTRLNGRDFLAGEYSIADIASWPWTQGYPNIGIDVAAEFPNLKAWQDRIRERPAVQRALARAQEVREAARPMSPQEEEERRKVLFNQRAR